MPIEITEIVFVREEDLPAQTEKEKDRAAPSSQTKQNEPKRAPAPVKEEETFSFSFKIEEELDGSTYSTDFKYTLPVDQVRMEQSLAFEMEDLYILHGTPGLDALGLGIGQMSDVAGVEATYRAMLPRPYGIIRKDIEKRAEVYCQEIEKAAVKIALPRLTASHEEVIRETARYFDRITERGAASFLQSGPTNWGLNPKSAGPGEALIGALVEIRKLRKAWIQKNEEFGNQIDRLSKQANTSSARAIKKGEDLNALISQNPEMGAAAEKAMDARQRFTAVVAHYCAQYPVLHRLYNTPHVPVYPEGWRNYLVVPDKPEVMNHLIVELFTILKTTEENSRKLGATITDEPSTVWIFRPLIAQTLQDLHYASVSFAGRAATERMKKEEKTGVEDWCDYASRIAGGLSVVATVAPPISAILAAVSLVLSTPSIIRGIREKYQTGRGANATLDPSKSLAGENSYAFFLFSVALMVMTSKWIPKKVFETLALLDSAKAVSEKF